jgi:hypothetical protein
VLIDKPASRLEAGSSRSKAKVSPSVVIHIRKVIVEIGSRMAYVRVALTTGSKGASSDRLRLLNA